MLTRRQAQILDFIKKFTDRHSYPPSLEEIGRHLKLSAVSTVHYHVEQLAQKGFIAKRWNVNRSLEVVAPPPVPWPSAIGPKGQRTGGGVGHRASPVALAVPLAGVIAAGRPIEAVEQEETIELPPSFIGRKDTYVLRVQGDSMIEEHIRDGDYVVVEKREAADNGETVVALLNGSEATLKKFYREKNGMIRLQPANPKMAPIFVPEEGCQIQGVVIAILRKFR